MLDQHRLCAGAARHGQDAHLYGGGRRRERVDGSRYPWTETAGFDDATWPAASALWFNAKARGLGTDGNWMLTPRGIPPMEERMQRLAAVRRSEKAIFLLVF